MITLDPKVFAPEAVAPETDALNQWIIATMSALPDKWSFPPEVIREARRQGRSIFPVTPTDPRAEVIEISGPHGPIPLRIIRPDRAPTSNQSATNQPANPPTNGIFMHIHGGGWMFGAADQQEDLLSGIVDATGYTVVSVDYRLSPEHPYPHGPDDCEAAALWLAENSGQLFGTRHLVIGGESAGAHLSVITLIRLRDRQGITPFSGAVLNAGLYDMGLSPSVRRFGEEPLILTTRDTALYACNFLRDGDDPRDPDISPIHADLTGLPPALFSIGTRDALLDDSLFMSARWLAAGNRTELAVYSGGCHVFQLFDFPMAHQARARAHAFLKSLL